MDEWRDCGILVVLLKYTVDPAPGCDKNSYWIENVHMGACFLWALNIMIGCLFLALQIFCVGAASGREIARGEIGHSDRG